ncbi:MAG: cupin domain-containing protein [Bacteroidales bacterium]|nr:cupin domain-containing protein [Bacteroidales bacterium]
MKLILLSGGSGKRLWPLSNDTRSKQFLPVLQMPGGGVESMIQRIVRQIRETGLADHFTVATNAAQVDLLTNQLGESVDIVTEPVRRKTFPAIALSAAYLAFEKQVPADEPVVVMPCDAYTDHGYFETVRTMVRAVETQAADWVLMGIRPTHASPRYGYVLPGREPVGTGVFKVERFVEKPPQEEAGRLMAAGALWNGGVFAFRLGRMMSLLAQYMPAESFAGVRAHYTLLPEINFDCEVIENARSVAVVPFDGPWKDLGSWHALTEQLPLQSSGNVHLAEDNVNTHVINELGIPVLCAGMHDAVVACSPDGILVCAKNAAEGVKPYAHTLSVRPMYEERRWGTYRVIDSTTYGDGYKSLTKSLTIHAGKHISYQVHRHRDEVWTFVDGTGLLVLDGRVQEVRRGDVVHIRKGQFHAVKALADLQLIEVQIGDDLVEEDIERYDWDWNAPE